MTSASAEARFLTSPLHDVFRAVGSVERDVIPLHVGEPGYGAPNEVDAALRAAFAERRATYCDAAGLPQMRGRLADKVRAETGRDTSAEHVVVTPGSTQALYALLTALACPGDEVILPVPYWPVYVQQCAALGLSQRFYEVDANGEVDLAQLKGLLGPRTAALLVNSPSNPGGVVLSRRALSGILELTAKDRIPIISDEAYEDFVFEGEHESIADIEISSGRSRRVWVVHTFSKTFALTGLRMGYLVAPSREAAERVVRVQEASLVCPSTPSQYAALAALAVRESAVARARAHLQDVRERVFTPLIAASLVSRPSRAGWYVMCRVPAWAESTEWFVDFLLREHSVGVAPGHAFVACAKRDAKVDARWVRLALCGEPDVVERGVRRICAAVRAG